ncbi:hypothetical protein [Microbacterium protaetiae]|uniref:hypothetical protein n=1 Tax=Microbacterium protaetiae TaxID=2509458 RepID=UPI0013E9EA67|nr:hypothetical protein [Microbacterium protaetiae]
MIVLVAGMGLLSACSGAAAPKTTPPPDTEKDIARWALPFDGYSPTNAQTMALLYARSLVASRCMQRDNVPWVVPPMNPEYSQGESYNDYGFRLSSPALAKKWGFHQAPARNTFASNGLTYPGRPTDPQEGAVYDRCFADAENAVPADARAALHPPRIPSQDTTADVRAAAVRWHTCMLPAGVSDLPDDPLDFPTSSLIAEFGLDGDAAPGAPETISMAERRLALKDAQCRESSGYLDALYGAEWAAEEAYIADHGDEFAQAAQNMQALRKYISDTIGSLGGA